MSLLDVLNIALRARLRLAVGALLCGAAAVLPLLFQRPTYSATASFILQGVDQSRSSLAGLAGQLGVALPQGASPLQSPQFYAEILKSREILGRIADDSFAVGEPSGGRASLSALLNVSGSSAAIRHDRVVRLLAGGILDAGLSKVTGVVSITATTPWKEVSLGIVRRALDGLNGFSIRMRQEQAAADRRYSEERLSVTRDSLRASEDRLQHFLQSNRQYASSPELLFEHDRLLRDVTLQQQVFTVASETYEDARAREMRNTPVLTMVDSPAANPLPNPRGRLRQFILGALIGLLIALLVALAGDAFARRRLAGEADVQTLRVLLREVQSDLSRWAPARRSRARVGSGN